MNWSAADKATIATNIEKLETEKDDCQTKLNDIRDTIYALKMIMDESPKDLDGSVMPDTRLQGLKTGLIKTAVKLLPS